MGFGNGGYLAISKQNSFGTATTTWNYIPFVSESLVDNIEHLEEESIQDRYEAGESHDGLMTVEGDIVMEMHPVVIGHFLRAVLGAHSYTAVMSDKVSENYFEPIQSYFDTDCALPPYTIQVFRDVGSAYEFTDCLVNELTLELSTGGFNRVTASVLARTSSLMDPTTSSYEASTPFAWNANSFELDGSGNTDLETFTLKIGNALEGVATMDTTKRWSRFVRNGYRTYEISGTMDFNDHDEYKKYRASSAQAIVINIEDDANVTSGYHNFLKIDMPRVEYRSFEGTIGGPNRIQANFEAVGKYHTGSLNAMLVTLQNSVGGY